MTITPYSEWLGPVTKPLLFAGPCSVESESQMLETAHKLAANPAVSALRGGVWKPRTSPGSFEGIGQPALAWLKRAGRENGLPVLTEVATAHHVEQALKAGIDMLWIGARTTVNPFYVQEIAEALQGVDIPVFVKNPIHPEVKLWVGALERLERVGIHKLGAIHRGFYAYQSQPFRNDPKWEVLFELRHLVPELLILCDPSHIAGRAELIGEVCQSALDLGMDGFMIEAHREPSKALSDAKQQVTPEALKSIYEQLELRHEAIDDRRFIAQLENLRQQIDTVDQELLDTLQRRLAIVGEIGPVKYQNKATIFQMQRWFKVLEHRIESGKERGLDPRFIHEIFQLIHKYSIDEQISSQPTH